MAFTHSRSCRTTFSRRAGKQRPVVVLTRAAALEFLSEVTIAPVTSTIRDVPTEVLLTRDDGVPRTCAVNLDHVQAVSRAKVGALIATFDKAGADLLFGFISQRYERRSLVVTTNLPFARWSEVFLDATAAAAVIDRIVHHATVLTTAGDSYRLKVATRNQASRATQEVPRQ